jgi:hypothetical protein
MRWFRSNVQLGSRLALLALAIQFVLSFSHVHFDGLSPAQPDLASVAIAGETDSTSPQPPISNHDPLCPICVLIQLAGAIAQPAPPVLHLPDQFDWTPPETSVASVLPASAQFFFNARAPPSA